MFRRRDDFSPNLLLHASRGGWWGQVRISRWLLEAPGLTFES